MEQNLISVIIPVYNTEQYLKKCLDSILNQTYTNLEVICINDGSTDKSLKILNNYVKTDKRIKIINQNNLGASYSRNVGIKNAKGEWISFIDSDDYVDLKLYENLINAYNKDNSFSIYCFNGVIISPQDSPNDENLRRFFYMNNWKNNDNNLYQFSDCLNPFYGNLGIWNKIYKTDFLRKYNIFFKNSIFEDQLFAIESMIKADYIYLDNQNFYYYVQHSGSTMHTLKENGFDIFNIMADIKGVLIDYNLYQLYQYSFLQHKFNVYYYLLQRIDAEYRKQFYERAKRNLSNESVAIIDKEKIKNIDKSYLFYDFVSLDFQSFIEKHRIQ